MEVRIIDRIDKTPKGRKIKYFNRFSLDLRYDSVASAFSFEWFFDPSDKRVVELAHVSHFHIVVIEHKGKQLLKGYLLSESFTDKSSVVLNSCAGYSMPGVLEDCQIPTDISLQFEKLSLRQIAEKLIAPFDFNLIIDQSVASDADSVFDISQCTQGDSIKKFITDLAAQKNINITHDSNGNLLFTRVKTNLKPSAHFERSMPGVEMQLVFNGQEIHSQITVVKQASIDGGNASESTLKNPYAPYVFRPKVIKQDSGTDIDTILACKNAIAEELKAIKLVIKTDRWENSNGDIFKPNTVISVTNPNVFIYEKTNWFVESVSLKGDEKETLAVLTCVLPEVYNGKTPVNIFTRWEK